MVDWKYLSATEETGRIVEPYQGITYGQATENCIFGKQFFFIFMIR